MQPLLAFSIRFKFSKDFSVVTAKFIYGQLKQNAIIGHWSQSYLFLFFFDNFIHENYISIKFMSNLNFHFKYLTILSLIKSYIKCKIEANVIFSN